jgi:hypothetical protein
MPELRAGDRRQPVDGRAVEPVLHHLPGADRGTAMREEIAKIEERLPDRGNPHVKFPSHPDVSRFKNQHKLPWFRLKYRLH